jgi:hypothetical protein
VPAALETVTSPAVLAFLLGVFAALLRSDVRLPDAVHTALSSYLLLAIGLKGGAGLREAGLAEVAVPVLAAVALGVVTPLLAWGLLRLLTRLDPVDRAAVTAHYGSTSLVTFTAAVALLESQEEDYEAYAATLLAVLEVPGILVGCCWPAGPPRPPAPGGPRRSARCSPGAASCCSPAGWRSARCRPRRPTTTSRRCSSRCSPGSSVLFLLDLGVLAGRRLRDVPAAGPGLVVAAIVIPLVNGSLGVLVGTGGRPVARRGGPARRAHRQRVLHRRAGCRAARPAAGQPRLLPDHQPGDHVPLQPGGGDPVLSRARPSARLRGWRRCAPSPSSA